MTVRMVVGLIVVVALAWLWSITRPVEAQTPVLTYRIQGEYPSGVASHRFTCSSGDDADLKLWNATAITQDTGDAPVMVRRVHSGGECEFLVLGDDLDGAVISLGGTTAVDTTVSDDALLPGEGGRAGITGGLKDTGNEYQSGLGRLGDDWSDYPSRDVLRVAVPSVDSVVKIDVKGLEADSDNKYSTYVFFEDGVAWRSRYRLADVGAGAVEIVERAGQDNVLDVLADYEVGGVDYAVVKVTAGAEGSGPCANLRRVGGVLREVSCGEEVLIGGLSEINYLRLSFVEPVRRWQSIEYTNYNRADSYSASGWPALSGMCASITESYDSYETAMDCSVGPVWPKKPVILKATDGRVELERRSYSRYDRVVGSVNESRAALIWGADGDQSGDYADTWEGGYWYRRGTVDVVALLGSSSTSSGDVERANCLYATGSKTHNRYTLSSNIRWDYSLSARGGLDFNNSKSIALTNDCVGFWTPGSEIAGEYGMQPKVMSLEWSSEPVAIEWRTRDGGTGAGAPVGAYGADHDLIARYEVDPSIASTVDVPGVGGVTTTVTTSVGGELGTGTRGMFDGAFGWGFDKRPVAGIWLLMMAVVAVWLRAVATVAGISAVVVGAVFLERLGYMSGLQVVLITLVYILGVWPLVDASLRGEVAKDAMGGLGSIFRLRVGRHKEEIIAGEKKYRRDRDEKLDSERAEERAYRRARDAKRDRSYEGRGGVGNRRRANEGEAQQRDFEEYYRRING